jgi:hypothetical protein
LASAEERRRDLVGVLGGATTALTGADDEVALWERNLDDATTTRVAAEGTLGRAEVERGRVLAELSEAETVYGGAVAEQAGSTSALAAAVTGRVGGEADREAADRALGVAESRPGIISSTAVVRDDEPAVPTSGFAVAEPVQSTAPVSEAQVREQREGGVTLQGITELRLRSAGESEYAMQVLEAAASRLDEAERDLEPQISRLRGAVARMGSARLNFMAEGRTVRDSSRAYSMAQDLSQSIRQNPNGALFGQGRDFSSALSLLGYG